ncbi:MAG: hypothetical protein COB02_11300 [Candidatus Cloacimonadota bacterium]|nr:MAG: hypothetical protein COB02_11300 [Candidatus Cloacimonadota bacterium]
MSDIQWEYCQVCVINPNIRETSIMFSETNGRVRVHKFTKGALSFEACLGLVGGVGWEMVSTHLIHDSCGGLKRQYAYFKRQKETGRKIDEPRIIIPTDKFDINGLTG